MKAPNYMFCKTHTQPCLVVETEDLWGKQFSRVWLIQSDTIVRVASADVVTLESSSSMSKEALTCWSAAAKLIDAFHRPQLLAPMESAVTPLPHQIHALARVMEGTKIRFLLADEVGLGKTIEAGLIMKELKLRGRVKRTLVIAPKGLVTQWVSEMDTHFRESFQVVLPSDVNVTNLGGQDTNPWNLHDQVVCPMDAVKPLDSRRGWNSERVAEFNRIRFDALLTAGWDLIIVDEAHRLGGSTEQVARYKLGLGLSEASPYLLLLSATPHQGKSDGFLRLLGLLDKDEFIDDSTLSRERVSPYIVRTDKRSATDFDGNRIFKPRHTQLVPVPWKESHHLQRKLYEAVSSYVRDGYNRAIQDKRHYIGFLLILMQRLVSSSSDAIRVTLEKRLHVLEEIRENSTQSQDDPINLSDLDGQAQLDILTEIDSSAVESEVGEVKVLLDLATKCCDSGIDCKAEALLDWIVSLQREESDPELKVLIFTEFVPTQRMLKTLLENRGYSVVDLNGSMDLLMRKHVQDVFRNNAKILISTDAGGEGLNLQFCHIVINYDLPWNPMRIEQRIGRVDRIGQKHTAKAINLVLEESVDFRVQQVLETKLATIAADIGIDKISDVLDSSLSGVNIEHVFIDCLLDPSSFNDMADSVIANVKQQIRDNVSANSAIPQSSRLDLEHLRNMTSSPVPFWTERFLTSFAMFDGGYCKKSGIAWEICSKTIGLVEKATFFPDDAVEHSDLEHIAVDDLRIQKILSRVPRFVRGQSINRVIHSGIPKELSGIWSLWKVAIIGASTSRENIIPIFVSRDGKSMHPSARKIWDELIASDFTFLDPLSENWADLFDISYGAAKEVGASIYDDLVLWIRNEWMTEREKRDRAVECEKQRILKIGLSEVREYRLRRLNEEHKAWIDEWNSRKNVEPEMSAILMCYIGGE